MTPEQFKAWRKRHDLSQEDAGDCLGLSTGTIGNYEAGRRRDGGDVEIPKTVELACMAVSMGLNEYVDADTLLELGEKPGATERAKAIAALITQNDERVWPGDVKGLTHKAKYLERAADRAMQRDLYLADRLVELYDRLGFFKPDVKGAINMMR